MKVMHLLTKGIRSAPRLKFQSRFASSITEECNRQVELFNKEKRRQRESIGRVEKIEIQYEGSPENVMLTMNKYLSTPYDCAKHIGDNIKERSVVALLNDKSLWHLHKPLPDSCKLEFLHYHMPNPAQVNKVFWRTCCYLLGAVVNQSFKDNIEVKLHSFPSPNVKSGSFVYDVQLSVDNWSPSVSELKVLSLEMIQFCQKNYRIEHLEVDKEFALELFKSNPHKTEQIPNIAAHNDDKVTLFRTGPHIDISRGPMLPDTSHLGRITVTNVFKLDTDIPGGPVYRFQGVALPKALVLNHFAYSLIEDRGRVLNSSRIPGSQDISSEDNTFVASVTQ